MAVSQSPPVVLGVRSIRFLSHKWILFDWFPFMIDRALEIHVYAINGTDVQRDGKDETVSLTSIS